jgi:hypothetical protein
MQQFTENVVLYPNDRRYQEFGVTVNVQNVGLTLKHKLHPNTAWIDGHAEKCHECYGQRYSHFEHAARVPLLKCTPNF